MSELIISVSGLRGVIGQGLTPEIAARYACAFAAELPPGSILITRDGRASGSMLADAIGAALCAVGRDVCDADIAATPTTGVLVRHLEAVGGIQISASHNPAEFNGMKLFSPAGSVLTAAAGKKVLARYHNEPPRWVASENVGRVTRDTESARVHLERVLECVDQTRIAEQQFRVLLDSNHGAGSLLGRPLLEALGCTVTLLGGEPDGQFEHTPEPTAENLQTVCQQAAAARADVVFCQDPDADRLAIIDEQSNYIGEEFTLALCVEHVLSQTPGAVVTNCSTSRMTADLADKYGATCFRSAVGEANVVECMQRENAVFGGEGNGGPIDPRVGYVRDSLLGMALVLDLMAARNKPISEIVADLPHYEIHKTKVSLDRDKIPAALDALEATFADAKANRLDGLRLDWENAWLLVRASNTEPVVRAIAEAETRAAAEQLCRRAGEVLAGV